MLATLLVLMLAFTNFRNISLGSSDDTYKPCLNTLPCVTLPQLVIFSNIFKPLPDDDL